VVLFGLLQLPLILALHVNDRYFLFLVPSALVALCARAPMSMARWATSLALVIAMAAFSLALDHDFLAWNRARCALGRRAVKDGMLHADIEGGYEWDGWYGPETLPLPKLRPPRGLALPLSRWRLPFVNGKYALSFSTLPETVELGSEPYSQWLVPGQWRY